MIEVRFQLAKEEKWVSIIAKHVPATAGIAT